MLIRETFVNETEGYRFGESDPCEPWTDDIGRLFLDMQREYGRCTGKVYVDPAEGGPPIAVGWVFEKRMRYEDARGHDPDRDYYKRTVWVTLYDRFERRETLEADYHAIGSMS